MLIDLTTDGVPFRGREGTSDERTVIEVVRLKTYRCLRDGFDVLPGERWLDLGANIGAFALYCRLRGAVAECWEPDLGSFRVLEANLSGWEGFSCVRSAVTDRKDRRIDWWESAKPGQRTRGTTFPGKGRLHRSGTVPNAHASVLDRGFVWDGVKMDVEGSEFGLIDGRLLPPTRKLILEYHLSRDPSTVALAERVGVLRETFSVVTMNAEMQRLCRSGESGIEARRSVYDRLIRCRLT